MDVDQAGINCTSLYPQISYSILIRTIIVSVVRPWNSRQQIVINHSGLTDLRELKDDEDLEQMLKQMQKNIKKKVDLRNEVDQAIFWKLKKQSKTEVKASIQNVM